MKLLKLALLVFIVFSITNVFAQKRNARTMQNGKKAMVRIAQQFDKMDSDKDSFISLEEYEEMDEAKNTKKREAGKTVSEVPVEKKFARLDVNQDGKIDMQEFQAVTMKKMKRKTQQSLQKGNRR